MREVRYAGGSFVTSDEVADALIEYAAALANVNRAATIHVPTAVDADQPEDVTVLVGPASQLMAEAVDDVGRDPDGTAFLTSIADRIAQLQPSYIVPSGGYELDWDI